MSMQSIIDKNTINELEQYFEIFGKYTKPENFNFFLVNALSITGKYFSENKLKIDNLYYVRVPCLQPFQCVYPSFKGDISLCCRDNEGDLFVGNVNDDSISNIFNNEKADAIRELHSDMEKMKKSNLPCKKCIAPKPGISQIVNAFIQYHANKNPKKLQESLIVFLNELNGNFKNVSFESENYKMITFKTAKKYL